MNAEILKERYEEQAKEINRLRAEVAQLKKQKAAMMEEHNEVKELRKENKQLKEELSKIDNKWNSKYYNLQQRYYAAKKFQDAMYRAIGGEEVRKIRKSKEQEQTKKQEYIKERMSAYGNDEYMREIIEEEADEMELNGEFIDGRRSNGRNMSKKQDDNFNVADFENIMSQEGGISKALSILKAVMN